VERNTFVGCLGTAPYSWLHSDQ